MTANRLYSRATPGSCRLQNRMVMAPMTRSRAIEGTPILSGGYDAARAESDLAAGNAGLLVRWRTNASLNPPDFNTFYTPGPGGIRIIRRCSEGRRQARVDIQELPGSG